MNTYSNPAQRPAEFLRRPLGLCLVGLFLTPLAGAAPLAIAPASQESPLEREAEAFRELRRALLAHAQDPERASEEGLARQLAALGEPLIPVVFDLLLGSEEPPAWQRRVTAGATPQPEDVLPEDALPIGPLEQRILMEILAQLPEPQVLPAIRARMEGADIGTRRVLALVLGRLGSAGGLTALLELLQGIAPEHVSRAFVHQPFEAALSELLCVRPQLHANLRAALLTIDNAYWPPLIRGVAQARRTQGFDLIAGLLGREEELDDLLLEGLAELAADERIDAPEQTLDWLGPYLEDPLWSRRHACLRIFGAGGGVRAAQVLVGGLADEHALVRHGALRALQEISGRRFGAEEGERWTAWLAQEQSWQEGEGETLRPALAENDPARLQAVLAALELHPLAITPWTADLGRALGRSEEPGLRRALVATLARSRSSTALVLLVGALGDEHAAVALAARNALRDRVGFDLGPELSAWELWLWSGEGRP